MKWLPVPRLIFILVLSLKKIVYVASLSMLNFYIDFVLGSLSDESREARRRAVLEETTASLRNFGRFVY